MSRQLSVNPTVDTLNHIINLQRRTALFSLLESNRGTAPADLSDATNGFLSLAESRVYLALNADPKYQSGILGEEERLINSNLAMFASALSNRTQYVDLGPGTAKKSIMLLQHLTHALPSAYRFDEYFAIDISELILDCAMNNVTDTRLVPVVKGAVGNFLTDSYRSFISPDSFVYLGATYGNFDKRLIHDALLQNAPSATYYLSSQARRADGLAYYEAQYHPEMLRNQFGSILTDIGLSRSEGVPFISYDDQSYINVNFHLKPRDKEKRDWYPESITVYKSWKPSFELFRQEIGKDFAGEFFTDGNFHGFLGKAR